MCSCPWPEVVVQGARDEEDGMANEEHLALLKQGVKVWNRWREEHREVFPDLEGADLDTTDLQGSELYAASLSGASLIGANLSKANLGAARLRQANLFGANLSGANLRPSMSRGMTR